MDNPHVENANQDMAMFELDRTEIEAVSGGISNDTGYGAALGVAGGFLAMGALGAAALTPVGMGVMLGASIVSSGVAMYYAAQ